MSFLFSHPKKLRREFFHFGVFKQDQITHPKRNEQGAQTLVARDIFVKKSHPLWRVQKLLDFNGASFFYL